MLQKLKSRKQSRRPVKINFTLFIPFYFRLYNSQMLLFYGNGTLILVTHYRQTLDWV